MNYFLYKLHFQTPVHFGRPDSALSLETSAESFCADTLFSALCITALSLYGEQALRELCEQARQGSVLFTDGMPWRGDSYYLPKPFILSKERQDIPPRLRKAMKRLAWIPVSSFDVFVDSIHSGALYEPDEHAAGFGAHVQTTKANVADGTETMPYQVGSFMFAPDCGLYVLVGCETAEHAELLNKLMTALGLSGIGGKVSAGYGKFTVAAIEPLDSTAEPQLRWLRESLTNEQAERFLLLTTSLPEDQELETAMDGAYYQLTRRAGFVQSRQYASADSKKQEQYFFSAGSMFQRRFHGTVYDVGNRKGHSVYRYSKPIFLGVSL